MKGRFCPHRPLTCRTVGRVLQSYLDAEMTGASALLVAEHLDDCRRCGVDADLYRWLTRSLTNLADPDDPEPLARLRALAEQLATSGDAA